MNASLRECMLKRVERTRENLKKNGIDSFYVETRQDVVTLVKTLIQPGATVSVGGSVTLDECGVLELINNGDYDHLDRYRPGLSRPEVEEIFRKSFFADVYLSSSNAVTERGELYNVDGNSNRVAAIVYGPKSVIMVCGVNKIVANIDEAIARVKNISAPANAMRLNCDTHCAKTGKCAGVNGGMADGCACDARICANYVVSARQRNPGRIKVILVGESLGY